MDVKEIIQKIKDKFYDMGLEDYFPLMRKYSTDDPKELAIMVGIYLAAAILGVIIIFGIGWIPFIGIIFKIAAYIIIIYSVIGMFAALLTFLKYN
ncbi:MAG: hypothetical protein IJ740_05525 [Ruminococcus sp.]|nr:hypothetical protein [Ruminococcus sp.]